ncbi:hypothetical protein AMTRI_Chr10g230490 [Amborella trichopoda]
MLSSSLYPDGFTFPFAFKACASVRDIGLTRLVHGQAAVLSLSRDGLVGTALVSAYARCCAPEDATKVFDEMCRRDGVAWTALVSAYSMNGWADEAFEAFGKMMGLGCVVDSVTLSSLLLACTRDLWRACRVHAFVAKAGFECYASVCNSLIDAYAKCGAYDEAMRVFRSQSFTKDVVSWNTVIAGLALNKQSDKALAVYEEMTGEGVKPNRITLLSLLPACGEFGCSKTAKIVHESFANDAWFDVEADVVVATALIHMHAKCGNVELARDLFEKLERSKRNVVSWRAMIAGYEHGFMPEESLKLFDRMVEEGDSKPNSVTIVSALSACAQLGVLQRGRMIHGYAEANGLDLDPTVASALIDMYGKCGDMGMAREIFSKMAIGKRTIVSWTSMMGIEGLHGHGMQAVELFNAMIGHGVRPNEVTFVCVLSACSHSGLVDDGWNCFDSMIKDHGIEPNARHYSCMVDLLGRAGRLEEAHKLIMSMAIEPDACVWGALLGACRLHGEIGLGELAQAKLFSLNTDGIGHQVLLATMYASAGKWDDVIRTRVQLKHKGAKKIAGLSFIEIGSKLHAFIVEDRSHPDSDRIYRELEALDRKVTNLGYIPDTSSVVLDMEECLKRQVLKYHSERLAMAFGILRTGSSEPIRITKNLRICGDCHVYTKFVSKVTGRELIIRDARRFHHFKDGLCSCSDYW